MRKILNVLPLLAVTYRAYTLGTSFSRKISFGVFKLRLPRSQKCSHWRKFLKRTTLGVAIVQLGYYHAPSKAAVHKFNNIRSILFTK